MPINYEPKYTDFEAVKLKLEGRLLVVDENTFSPPPFPSNSLKQEISVDLVRLIMREQENFLDLILCQIYQLPLKNEHGIITDIATNLVMAEILTVYNQSSELALVAKDASNAVGSYKNSAYEKLEMLTFGWQVKIPGKPLTLKSPGMQEFKKITLKGESVDCTPAEQIPVNNETFVQPMNQTLDRNNNPFSEDYYPYDNRPGCGGCCGKKQSDPFWGN